MLAHHTRKMKPDVITAAQSGCGGPNDVQSLLTSNSRVPLLTPRHSITLERKAGLLDRDCHVLAKTGAKGVASGMLEGMKRVMQMGARRRVANFTGAPAAGTRAFSGVSPIDCSRPPAPGARR
jgi:hypothetical protein